jgi:formate/nitrite transporter FocA (FNT family)
VLGSLTFGIGFVFLTIGRSELFTENFLIPVAAVLSGHATRRSVGRLWAITFALNLAGVALFVVMLSTPGVLERESLEAAGGLTDTLAERDLPAAAVSAVLGGAVITVFTWLAEAAPRQTRRPRRRSRALRRARPRRPGRRRARPPRRSRRRPQPPRTWPECSSTSAIRMRTHPSTAMERKRDATAR